MLSLPPTSQHDSAITDAASKSRLVASLRYAPLVCAIHCVATPVIVLAVPVLGHIPALEWGAWVLAVVIGVPDLRSGWSIHRSVLPVGIAALSIPLWGFTLAFHHGDHTSPIPLAVAAVATSAALLINARLRHKSISCCAEHAHSD